MILITAFYTGLLTLVFLFLSLRVIRLRFKFKVGIGDGDHKLLAKAIRVHGNFFEYVPLTILLLALFEINGGTTLWVHVFGAVLVVARLLHAIGLNQSIGTSYQRMAGTIFTFVVMLVLASVHIVQFVF